MKIFTVVDTGSELKKISIKFRPVYSWGEIKGSGDGEGKLRGKKEKKRKCGENKTFCITKSKNWLLKHNSTLFEP